MLHRNKMIWQKKLKNDKKKTEKCCANDRFLSKMTPTLRAESTGESMTLLGT